MFAKEQVQTKKSYQEQVWTRFGIDCFTNTLAIFFGKYVHKTYKCRKKIRSFREEKWVSKLGQICIIQQWNQFISFDILTNKICVIFKFINHTFALLSKKVSSWCYELKSNCIKHHKTSHYDSLAKVDVALINYSEDKLRKP